MTRASMLFGLQQNIREDRSSYGDGGPYSAAKGTIELSLPACCTAQRIEDQDGERIRLYRRWRYLFREHTATRQCRLPDVQP